MLIRRPISTFRKAIRTKFSIFAHDMTPDLSIMLTFLFAMASAGA